VSLIARHAPSPAPIDATIVRKQSVDEQSLTCNVKECVVEQCQFKEDGGDGGIARAAVTMTRQGQRLEVVLSSKRRARGWSRKAGKQD
jgi:hypothetical protein